MAFMDDSHQVIIDKLYALYQSKGFINEEEALDLMASKSISLQDTERITGHLLGMGVIFADEKIVENEGDVDRAQVDYTSIYLEVLTTSPGLSSLVDYLRKIQPPQFREWYVLIPQAQNGNIYAHNRLFDMYLRVVVKLALRLHRSEGYELEDLIQEGSLGLLYSIEAYNSVKHGSFLSYFALWVMRYMQRAIAKKSRLIRIPSQMLIRLKNSINKLEKKRGYIFSIEDIAEDLNMTVLETQIIFNYKLEPWTLEEIVNVKDDVGMRFDTSDEDMMFFFNVMPEQSLRIVIDSSLDKLTSREEKVIRLRFGLDDDNKRTLEEVGEILGVTRERIRQIELKTLEKLQDLLELRP